MRRNSEVASEEVVFAHFLGHLIRMIQPKDKLSEVNWQEGSRRAVSLQ
jgi:hypothetical protein